MARLFHLTSIYHLPVILESGFIKVVESNISLVPGQEHAGPDVVWLTTNREPGQGWASMVRQFEYVDKCRIAIEVDPWPEAIHRWWDWCMAHGSSEHHRWALAVAGERGKMPGSPAIEAYRLQAAAAEWHVVERPIPWQEWVSITDQLAGAVIWQRDQAQIASDTFAMPRLFQPRFVTDAQKRAYFDRVAPSVSIANDLLGGDLFGR